MDNNIFEHDNFPPDLYTYVHEFPQIMENDEMYLKAKHIFEKYGYVSMGNDVKCYTPEIEWVLQFGKLVRIDYETNFYRTDRIEFYHCYKNAYEAERQSFDNKNAIIQQPKNSEEYYFYINYLKGKLDKCKIIFQNPDIITYHLCEKYGRLAGLFSRIIEIIGDDLNLQQRIKEIANNNTILLQRIIKLIPDIALQQISEPPPKLLTELICDKKLLQKLHADFDGKIWESVELETFLNYMRVEPIENIIPIVDNKEFARWLRANIENIRDAKLVTNMNKWFIKLIGKNINYSSQFSDY